MKDRKLINDFVMVCCIVIAICCCGVPALAETVSLSSLNLTALEKAGIVRADASLKGQPIRIGGKEYRDGIGSDSESGMTIVLDCKATRFTAYVGVDDNFIKPSPVHVDFQVWGDGKLLWRSGPMRRGEQAKPLDVNLQGISKMSLCVDQRFDFDPARPQGRLVPCCVGWVESRLEVNDGFRPKVTDLAHDDLIDDTVAQSAAPLATPVNLPFEKVLPGPVTDYVLLTAGSAWEKEYQLQSRFLPPEGFRYVQRFGRNGQGLKPWLMLRNAKTGQGIAASLAYSGNWSMEVAARGDNTVLSLSTLPSPLKPLDTVGGLPIGGALVAEFAGHWDCGAQPIVRFIRQKLLRDMGPDWPPVQYNEYYATLGNPTQQFVLDSAKAAAQIGCELFTVDCGWYGSDPTKKWGRQIGDWRENKTRFPDGLRSISDEVHRLGMKFGLWVEIECANPETPIGQQHPEWYLKEGEQLVAGRGALDFGKPEVLAWAKAEIDRIVETYNLDYIKMDFNTDLPLSDALISGDNPLQGHYRGLLELWRHIRQTHPKLIVENCSAGSQRQDLMSAAYTDTHWVSDNIRNNACLAQNYGATYLFPPEICSHWTTELEQNNPVLDLESQFTVNMMGHMGLSGKLMEWDARTRQVAAERIALYKKLRPLLRNADVYHLTPQASLRAPASVQAALYMDPSSGKAVLFAFHAGAESLQCMLPLRGLKEYQTYDLIFPASFGPSKTFVGKDLVQTGLPIRFSHSGASAVIEINPRH